MEVQSTLAIGFLIFSVLGIVLVILIVLGILFGTWDW